MKRTFAAVSTCHAAGYERYGRAMIQGFDRHWPAGVKLHFYCENFKPEPVSERVAFHDLLDSCPDLIAFKQRHADTPLAHGGVDRRRWHIKYHPYQRKLKLVERHWGRGFRWDAVRFAHKCFALFDAARHSGVDVLFWVDADTRFFADVDCEELSALLPPDRFVGFLRRPWHHSECGFVAYNLAHPATKCFLADFERLYVRDLLFKEYEFHDAYLFDIVRRRTERRGARAWDIAEGVGRRAPHVLINSRLGRFMDHMKGDRKELGASPAKDLVIKRNEAYWKQPDA